MSKVSFVQRFKVLKDKGEIANFWTFKLFGDWDIALIYECTEFKQDTLYAGTIPKIINSTEFFSFPWDVIEGQKKRSTFRRELMDNPTIGITFFKVHPEALMPESSAFTVKDLDQEFVRLVSSDQLSCLCSLGWAEFIIMTHGVTIDALIDNINNKLTNILVERADREGEAVNLAVKTFSMIGINYRCLEDKETLDQHLGSNLFAKDMKVSVSVTCDLPAMEEVRSRIVDTFFDGRKSAKRKIHGVIGNKDMSFEVDTTAMMNWANFVYSLLKFRREQKDKLFSTSVDIKSSRFLIHPYESVTSSRLPLVGLTEPQTEILRGRLRDLADLVISSIYYFNELVQNRINADSYQDMWQYVLTLLKDALEADVQSLNVSEDTPKRFNVLKYGAAQRSAGVFFNQQYQRGFPVLPKGGVQRIIQAAEAIPQYVYRAIYGENWPGFLICGYSARYTHEQGGAINIQTAAIFNPEKWWGLFHELGHSWVDSTPANQERPCLFADKTFQGKLQFNMGVAEADSNYNQEVRTISEVLADVFDYCFFSGKDFQSYAKIIWKFLLSEMKSDPIIGRQFHFYLFRSFYVFVYNTLYLEKKLNYDSLNFAQIGKLYESFIKHLKAANGQMPIKASTRDEVINYFTRYKWTLEHARESVERTGVDFYDPAEAETIKRDLIPQLREGSILSNDAITNPPLLILLLKRYTLSADFERSTPEERFKIRMATILSLWYYYQTIKPRLPYRAAE